MKMLILLFLLPLSAFAQGFNNRYDFLELEVGQTVWDIELLPDGYLLFLTGDNETAELVTVAITKLNFVGQILDEISFLQDSTFMYSGWSNSASLTSDGNFVVGGGWFRGFSMANLMLHDSTGDTLWMKQFGNSADSSWHTGRCAIEAPNGDFLMVGSGYESKEQDNRKGFVIRTDHQGNEIWRKYLGNGLENDFLSAIPVLGGGFVISGGILYEGWNRNIWVLRISDTGEIIWQQEFGEQGYRDLGGHLCEGNLPGTYLVGGGSAVYSQIDDVDAYPYVVKINGSGDIIWEQTFGEHLDDNAILSIKSVSSGGYIAAGLSLNPEEQGYVGYLVRIAENGDSLWMRNYQWTDANHSYFRDVIVSEEEGFVASGLVYPNDEYGFGFDSWVVKTDGYGCVVPGCEVSILENEQLVNFLTYPNPVESTLNIYFESVNDPEGKFVLTDMNGRLIKSFDVHYNLTTYAIDLSFLEGGMYQLVYKDSSQSITRSIVKL